MGTLQPALLDYENKGEETTHDHNNGILVVKVRPREYDSPMIPTCKFNCALSLSLRADYDYNGHTYLDVCELIMDEMERLQKCLDDVHDDYSFEGFNATGFQLGQGDTSINQTEKIWGYTHSFTVFGVIEDVSNAD